MSNPSHATVMAGIAAGSRGRWPAFCTRVAAFWVDCRQRRDAGLRARDLHQLSESELQDMGLPPELINEVRALGELERNRMKALENGYW